MNVHLSLNTGHGALCLDTSNAYNTMHRRAIETSVLLFAPGLHHLFRMKYRKANTVRYQKATFDQGEGILQGDSLGTAYYPLGKFLLDLIVQAILVDKPLSEVCLTTNALAIPKPAAQEILKQSGIEERVEHIRNIARDLLAQPTQSSDDSDPPQEPTTDAFSRQRQGETEEQAEHFDPSQTLNVDYLDDLVRLGPPPSLMVIAKIICEVYKCFGQRINTDKSFLHLQEDLADKDVPTFFSTLGIAIRRPSGDSDDAHGFELLGSVVGNKRYKARWLNGFANNLLSKATLLDALGSVDPQSAFLILTKSFVHKGRHVFRTIEADTTSNLATFLDSLHETLLARSAGIEHVLDASQTQDPGRAIISELLNGMNRLPCKSGGLALGDFRTIALAAHLSGLKALNTMEHQPACIQTFLASPPAPAVIESLEALGRLPVRSSEEPVGNLTDTPTTGAAPQVPDNDVTLADVLSRLPSQKALCTKAYKNLQNNLMQFAMDGFKLLHKSSVQWASKQGIQNWAATLAETTTPLIPSTATPVPEPLLELTHNSPQAQDLAEQLKVFANLLKANTQEHSALTFEQAPLIPEWTFLKPDWRSNIRMRLGLGPFSGTPPPTCFCGTKLTEDNTDHLLMCTQGRGGGITPLTAAHNAVQHRLKAALARVGIASSLEQPTSVTRDRRSDVCFTLGDTTYHVDVSTINPLGKSHIRNPSDTAAFEKPASRKREEEKYAHYEGHLGPSLSAKTVVLPFVLEATGGWGLETVRFKKILIDQAIALNRDANRTKQWFTAAISMAHRQALIRRVRHIVRNRCAKISGTSTNACPEFCWFASPSMDKI